MNFGCFGGLHEYAKAAMSDNSEVGLKGLFLWTGQRLRVKSGLFMAPKVSPQSHTDIRLLAHILICKGHFPSLCGCRVQPRVH